MGVKKWIEMDFEIGQIVYLKTDAEQLPRCVYGVIVRKTGILYELSCGANVSAHYDFEIAVDVKSITPI